jgi:hypothetical protein
MFVKDHDFCLAKEFTLDAQTYSGCSSIDDMAQCDATNGCKYYTTSALLPSTGCMPSATEAPATCTDGTNDFVADWSQTTCTWECPSGSAMKDAPAPSPGDFGGYCKWNDATGTAPSTTATGTTDATSSSAVADPCHMNHDATACGKHSMCIWVGDVIAPKPLFTEQFCHPA